MLTNHHLLSQIPLRVDSVIRRLQSQLWKDSEPLKVEATLAGAAHLSWDQARKKRLQSIEAHSCWGKLFDQRWCRITFPRKTEKGLWLHWKDQGEATLFVQGKPYFGFDVAHKYCRILPGLKEVWIECNCVQSAIWHPAATGLSAKGSLFEGAFLVRRDDAAWQTYHDMKCLFDVALSLRNQENNALPPRVSPGCTQAPVERHSPGYRRLLRWMDDAANALDTEGPAAASALLSKAYGELSADRSLMKAVLTGHAHIDLVWLWPERIGELKAVHTFSTVNRLMEEYPEFRFAYSQPASYEAVRRRSPALFKAVEGRIQSGKWEANGAMYVESDTLIPCGEALLRCFLVGQEFFRETTGEPSKLTWLPDVFGYSACLPQMMRLADVEYFFTTKMTWNTVNRFPYSSFVWKGNDGSEVIAHVTQDCGFNSSMEAAQLKDSSWGYQQGDIHKEYLMPTGYGDGGGGPTAEMCERARRMSNLPGMPVVEWDQPTHFFDRLAALKNRLPVFKGECYLEEHRGTFTTHSPMKTIFRALERTMQVSEAVSCVTSNTWDRAAAWKRLLFSQFHDCIPGSSVWDVYLEIIPEFHALIRDEEKKTVQALDTKKGQDCMFNPHAVAVERWVLHPKSKRPVRVRIPAMSGVSMDAAGVGAEADAVAVKGMHFSNGLVAVRINRQGWIEQLSFEGRDVDISGQAGQLMTYADRPANHEAWDVDRHTLGCGRLCDAPAKIETLQEAHRAGFRITRKVGKNSSATVTFSIEAGSPLLHVGIDLDWQDPHTLLKFIMPTGYLCPHARFGIPYGSVLRPQVVNGPASEAMWEVPFSRWLAVFDEAESDGLFAVTEAKYGTTVRDGVIGISLVRSPKAVGYAGVHPDSHSHMLRVQGPSQHTDIGNHNIRLAFGRYHSGLSRRAHPASLADTLFTEPVFYRGDALPSPIESMEGDETLLPAWAQPLDAASWILRLQEVGGRRGTLQLRSAPGWKMSACNATGVPEGRTGRGLRVDFQPGQIVSVLFRKT